MNGIEKFNDLVDEIQDEIISFLYQNTPDDVNVIVDRGAKLQGYMARLSKILADAKYFQDNAMEHFTRESKGQVAQPVMNTFVKSQCKDENYLVNLTEKLLAKCYAENEWNRTLVSKAKAEFTVSRTNQNGY